MFGLFKKRKGKVKKKGKVCRYYSGEYGGTSFEIKKIKTSPRKTKYMYSDGDVGTRELKKKIFENLKRKSELLYDEKKNKRKRGRASSNRLEY